MPRESASSARPRPHPVDLGWLFLLPGIVLIAGAVLIAAEDDLYAARFRRDEAVAIERRHAERVERYEAYLAAVKRRDPTVVRSLVAGQLNAEPTDMVEAYLPGAMVYDPGEVFASLEPPEVEPARRQRVDSVLARWATDDSSRVWLMASGALCVFVGLLPPVGRRGATPEESDQDAEEQPRFEDARGGLQDEHETEIMEQTDEHDEADEGSEPDEGSEAESSDPSGEDQELEQDSEGVEVSVETVAGEDADRDEADEAGLAAASEAEEDDRGEDADIELLDEHVKGDGGGDEEPLRRGARH